MPDSHRDLREPVALYVDPMIKTLLMTSYVTSAEWSEIAQPVHWPSQPLSQPYDNESPFTRNDSSHQQHPALSFFPTPRAKSLPKSIHHPKCESHPDARKKGKTYNSCHSLVVTDPTTTQPVHSLSLGELTGTRVFCVLWS